VPRPETGSFNRLITSLGLLCLAAALVIPYFYYRSTDVLEIERTELELLTHTARNSIESRQTHIADIQPYVLPLAGVLVVGGILFLIWGGLRLRGAQDLDDREAIARAITAEAGLRDLTPEEQENKLVEEVAPEPPPLQDNEETRRREEQRKRVETARRIEKAVSEALSGTQLEGYRFRPQVAVGRLKLDGLFLAEAADRPDVLLEIKVGSRFIHPMIRDRILAGTARYQAERDRPCRAWLLLVLPDDAESVQGRDEEEIRALKERLNRDMSPAGVASVVPESDIPRLQQIFVETFPA
jgi:hypothetical protein